MHFRIIAIENDDLKNENEIEFSLFVFQTDRKEKVNAINIFFSAVRRDIENINEHIPMNAYERVLQKLFFFND